jgi:alkylation response protein AidB-like acyl-CoA dehydrogenase
MDFGLTDEQASLRAATIEFARTELATDLVARDASQDFDRKLWRRCAEFGIQGSFVPTEYGGRGLDLISTIVVMEALGYGCRDNGFTLALNGQMWAVQEPIMRFGSDEQKRRLLPGLVDGTVIGADAVTETEAGSDTHSMSTTAVRSDGGYVLNGRKSYIGLGPVCDFALVFATSDPTLGQWGINAFLVDSDSPGFDRSEGRPKMGLRTEPLGDIVLEDVFVPEDARLGPEGAGASIFNHSLDWERSFIFASHVGAMERQLEDAIEYAGDRHQFGQPIGGFQSVSNRIADMRLRLETSRLLLYKAAWLMQTGQSVHMTSALAKLHIGEALVSSSMDAIRTHGARGYLSEFGVERDLRDTLGGIIYGGTSDIQRRAIARLLGL